MTIQVKLYPSPKYIIPVEVECSHKKTSYQTIENNADTFDDGNWYPQYYDEEILVCRNCKMFFNESLQCWDVL